MTWIRVKPGEAGGEEKTLAREPRRKPGHLSPCPVGALGIPEGRQEASALLLSRLRCGRQDCFPVPPPSCVPLPTHSLPVLEVSYVALHQCFPVWDTVNEITQYFLTLAFFPPPMFKN